MSLETTGDLHEEKIENAKALIKQANNLPNTNRNRSYRPLLKKAIAILEQEAPDSEELARAYLSMCWVHVLVQCRKNKRVEHQKAAVGWYEKAISVWRRNGNKTLAGNLCNLGSLYYRYGDYETSLARELEALELERQLQEFDDESVAPWNHAAGCYLALNRLDEAEAIVRDGLAVLGENTPGSAYLWETLSQVYSAKAKEFHRKAEELAPSDSCPI